MPDFSGDSARLPFVQTRNNECSASNCSVEFPVVGAKRRLEIENISCSVNVNAAEFLANPFISVQSSPVTEVFRFTFVPAKLGDTFGQAIYVVNYHGFIPVTAGRFARISMFTVKSSFVRVSCSISGTLAILR